MKQSQLTTTAISAALILTGGTAIADVSAADVWADWQKYYAAYGENGLTIESEEMSGDTLTISGLVLAHEDDFSRFVMNMGDLTFTERGDGTVRASMQDEMSMTIDSSREGFFAKVTVTPSNGDTIVSGDPDNLTYAISGADYSLVVDELRVEGEKIDGDIRLSMSNVSGTFGSQTADLQNYDYELTVGSLDILADVAPPNTGDSFTFSGKIQDIAMDLKAALPVDMTFENPLDIYSEGMSAAGGYTFGNSAYIFDVIAEGEQTAGSASTGAGEFSFGISPKHISYNALTNAIDMSIQGGAIPFPVEMSMAQYGAGVDMPIAKTEEPADFGLRLNMTDLAVNDTIWMLVDPSGQLPRDPATLLLDISGKMKLLFDWMDQEQAMMFAEKGDQPGELHEMTLNNFKLSAAGAEVTGAGMFTFDNDDLVSFDGMPAPSGDVTVNVKGANALIDRLVDMGLLPEDQAMMGRMMMGMFARTTGDDELSSKIEINDQGHVIANGQRIQ